MTTRRRRAALRANRATAPPGGPAAQGRRFARHLARVRPRLHRLRAAGLDNPNVLALLAVETFYRPRPARVLEYAAWAVFSVLRPGRVGRLSVGAAQVQLRHWHRCGQLPGIGFTPVRLATVLDWSANYHACHAFLAGRDALGLDDPVRLTRLYTGWDRPGYAERLRRTGAVLAS